MLVALIMLLAFGACIWLVARLAALNQDMATALEAHLDRLEADGMLNVGHMELGVKTFRIVAITADGWEGHVLLEVCYEAQGYTCYHYDDGGILQGERYVEFKT